MNRVLVPARHGQPSRFLGEPSRLQSPNFKRLRSQGIDSWAPYPCTNSGSVVYMMSVHCTVYKRPRPILAHGSLVHEQFKKIPDVFGTSLQGVPL